MKPISAYLRHTGCDVVIPDLPFFDRGIDVYAIRSRPRRLAFAVELKLYDWRKALRQAAIYQLCSDFSYVALPSTTVPKVQLDQFRQAGIGILSIGVTGDVSIFLKARRSTEQREFYLDSFRNFALGVAQHAR